MIGEPPLIDETPRGFVRLEVRQTGA